MGLRVKKQGIKKVEFWLIILMTLLSAAIGLRLGSALPAGLLAVRSLWAAAVDIALKVWQHLWEYSAPSEARFWIELVLAVIITAVFLILMHKYLPNKRKEPKLDLSFTPPTPTELQVVLYVGTAALFAYFVNGYGVFMVKTMAAELGFLTVAVVVQLIMVLQDVYVKRNSTDYVYFEQHKKSVLFKTSLIGLVLAGFPLWIPDFWGFTLPKLLQGHDLLSYYTAILSLTFISISVMSVLSDRSIVIYWENIAEGKLIKPVFGSFAAYTFYSIGAAIGAGISVIIGNGTAFIVFCSINIIAMILLTYTMVDVYYDRESKKARRMKELQEDTEDYIWVRAKPWLSDTGMEKHYIKDEKTGERYTQQEVKDKQIGLKRYEEKMILLCQNIGRAKNDHDLVYLQEVYALYREKLECFNTPAGRPIVQILFSACTAENWQNLISGIQANIDHMTAHPIRQWDPFAGDATQAEFWKLGTRWDQDKFLWNTMRESQYLRQWLLSMADDYMSTPELYGFIQLIAQRFVVLYNDMVTQINCSDPKANYDYLKADPDDLISFISTEQGKHPDREQIRVVSQKLFGKQSPAAAFAATLMRVLYTLVEVLDEGDREALSGFWADFPLPSHFVPFMAMYGFHDTQIEQWKSCFTEKE